jgi:hypothetical protein
MQCSECKSNLLVSNSKYESAEGSTDVFSVLTMVCVNPKCGTYAGTNLNEPLKIAATVRNKVS